VSWDLEDLVLKAMKATLTGDAELVATLSGKHVARMVEDEEIVPNAIRYTVVDHRNSGNTAALLVQLSYWAKSQAEAAAIRGRVKELLHSETRRLFGGVDMATLFEDGRDMPDPNPDVFAGSMDFRFEPWRRR
jgi:hypothetical protein